MVSDFIRVTHPYRFILVLWLANTLQETHSFLPVVVRKDTTVSWTLNLAAVAGGAIPMPGNDAPENPFGINSPKNIVNEGDDNVQMDRAMSSPSQETPVETSVDAAIMGRYACTRFRRNEAAIAPTKTSENDSSISSIDTTATISDPQVVKEAMHCLEMARRAPSGFNAQPYKFILVHSKEKKEALSKYCLGRNANRILDSECTLVCLADKQVGKTLSHYASTILGQNKKSSSKFSKFMVRKTQGLILLFSSGWPIPQFLGIPISFGIRLGVAMVSVLTGRRILVPSLSSAETWSTKNTMLVAMSYMLGCSSRGLATCPMEGYNAGGIRRALGIPRRYAIPLIISTGHDYHIAAAKTDDEPDDVGMSHGSQGRGATSRYPAHEVVFANSFGEAIQSSI
jgi:nitroreductase